MDINDSNFPSMNEKEIIEAICSTASEQKKALEVLYTQKGNEFKRFYKFKGLASEDASELMQEVIIKIFTNAKQYNGKDSYSDNSANSWMWTIARNSLNDFLNVKMKYKSISQDSLDNIVWSNENINKIKNAENQLIKEQEIRNKEIEIEKCVTNSIEEFHSIHPDRANVIMMQMDGCSIETIAFTINRTTNATKVYISECKKKLMPFLNLCYESMLAA